jgi:hypothetical protein
LRPIVKEKEARTVKLRTFRILGFIMMASALVSAAPVPGIKVPPTCSLIATVRLSRETPAP